MKALEMAMAVFAAGVARGIKVIDIESMTEQDMIRVFGRVFHGYGETLWIRAGKVIAQLEAFERESEPLIVAYTKRLLAEQPRESIL